MENKLMEYKGQVYDEERALYGLRDAKVADCRFEGPADGESALKECHRFTVDNCHFLLRYPLWHAKEYTLCDSVMTDTARAPIWYSADGVIRNCRLDGVKTLRECDRTVIEGCEINSPEFGWRCRGVTIRDSRIDSVYFLFESRDVEISGLHMTGKYSFQYMENVHIVDSVLDTKDAFWHSKNVTVERCTVKGEYLGWFSDGLTLIDCHISGTQPLCYCKNLKLINCTTEGTDLSFEYSDVQADIVGDILSVKNPRSGSITADSIGSVILEGSVMDTSCEITVRK